MFCLIIICDGRNFIELLVDSVLCFEEKDKRRKVMMFMFKKILMVNKIWIENNFVLDSYNVIVFYLVRKICLIRKIKLWEFCNNVFDLLSFI